jgi:hypothetical protein
MQPIVLALLTAAALLASMTPSTAADATADSEGEHSQLTLKERSSRKGADEQRVDDCKVPEAERGNRQRPADCGRR